MRDSTKASGEKPRVGLQTIPKEKVGGRKEYHVTKPKKAFWRASRYTEGYVNGP